MANPLKGEVDMQVGEATYTLALTIHEIIKIEDLLDIGILEIQEWFNDRSKIRAGNMRAMLWAALQRNHPEITLEAATDIMAAAGLVPVVVKLGEAIQASFPKAEKAATENPQKRARAGTGKRS